MKKQEIKKKFLCKLWDGTKVFVVEGKIIRDDYDNDFLLGRHGYVYKYIPKDEIWVEDEIIMDNEPEILAHELFEWYLMKYHDMKYKEAHKMASNFEKTLRDVSKIHAIKRDTFADDEKKSEH